MKITFVSILVITAVLIVSQGGLQVQSQKNPDTPLQLGEEIIVHKKFGEVPVKLMSVSAENKEVSLEKAFTKTSDWYKGLEFEIENTSGKTITYISFDLIFKRPEGVIPSKSDLNTLSYSIVIPFGNAEAFFAKQFTGVSIKPDETIKIPLKENYYNTLNGALTRLGYPSKFKGVEIIIQEVGFSDRSLWSYGLTYRQDPKDPAKWPPILEKI